MVIQIPQQNYLPKPISGSESKYIQPFALDEKTGKIVITLGSSQISDLRECKRKFHFRHVELIEINGTLRENSPLDLGTYWHSLMEAHYRKGVALTSSEMLRIRDKHSADPFFSLDSAGYAQVDRAYLSYTVQELLGSVKRITPMDAQKSVEVGFSEVLEETRDYVFILTGRIDLLGYESGSSILSAVDHKLQMRQRDLYSHSVQFRNYAMVTNVIQFIVNYVRLTKEPTFERSRIIFSPEDHRRWKLKLLDLYQSIFIVLSRPDLGGFNAFEEMENPTACGGKFGYSCQYTKICEPLEEMNSTFVQRIKAAHYHKVDGHLSWSQNE